MRSWILGLAAAVAVFVLFPTENSIPGRWAAATSTTAEIRTDSVTTFDDLAALDTSFAELDSTSRATDPFGLPPASAASKPTSIGPAVPAPPRPWTATGRVGQRAAVLTATDGRILVVSDGSRVDSALVVSIGPDGVVLEDRGGRFVLRIP